MNNPESTIRKTTRVERIFVLHNPVSGTTDFDHDRRAIAAHMDGAGLAFAYHVTAPGDSIAEIVRAAVEQGYDLVAAAGGDGTITAAADGLVGTGTPLGVLPLGSGNGLARELGIPLEIQAALDVLTGSARRRIIDSLKVDERHFLLNVSTGLSTQAVVSTEREEKRRLGKLAYLLQGVRSLVGLHMQRFTLTIDGRMVRTRATEIIAANTGFIGFKEVRLSPKIAPDDGQLHVCMIKAETLGDYLRLLAAALRGNPARLPELHVIPVNEYVRIEADREQVVQGDGEAIGSTPVEIRIARGSLSVVVPDG